MKEMSLVEALRETLDDRKLSRGERHAVKAMVARQVRTEHDEDVLRAKAFDLAREALSDPQSAQVVEWLEDVVRALKPSRDSSRTPRREAYFSPGDACSRRLVELLDGCRKSIDICVFTITDDRVTNAIEAAHDRGIPVRVLTDNEKAFDPGSDAYQMARHGLPVHVDITDNHMHHKFAIFDGSLLLTGSYNWTRSAARHNYENMVLLEEPRLVAEFAAEFEKILKNSVALRPN